MRPEDKRKKVISECIRERVALDQYLESDEVERLLRLPLFFTEDSDIVKAIEHLKGTTHKVMHEKYPGGVPHDGWVQFWYGKDTPVLMHAYSTTPHRGECLSIGLEFSRDGGAASNRGLFQFSYMGPPIP